MTEAKLLNMMEILGRLSISFCSGSQVQSGRSKKMKIDSGVDMVGLPAGGG